MIKKKAPATGFIIIANYTFLFVVGLFKCSNKILVSLAILTEWREYFKDDVPVTNMIR